MGNAPDNDKMQKLTEEIVGTYDVEKVGTTTAQDQFNMIKRQCKASNYGELSKNGDVITMKKTA